MLLHLCPAHGAHVGCFGAFMGVREVLTGVGCSGTCRKGSRQVSCEDDGALSASERCGSGGRVQEQLRRYDTQTLNPP